MRFPWEGWLTTLKSTDGEIKMKVLDKNFLGYVLLTFFLLMSQFLYPVNYFLLFPLFCFVILAIYKKWVISLIPFLVLSFLHGDSSVSIYTFKVYGFSLFYVILIICLFIAFFLRKSISKIELLLISYAVLYFAYSVIIGNFQETKYFIKDIIFVLVAIAFLFVFYENKEIPYNKVLLSITSGYFFSKIFVFWTGIGLEVVPYSIDVLQYNAIFDPIENFLVIYNLQSIMFPTRKEYRYISIVNLILFTFSCFLLGYVHGATIMLLVITLLYNLMRRAQLLIILAPIIFLVGGVIVSGYSYDQKGESVFAYKLEKVASVFQFVYDAEVSIYDLPRSTQVRFIESANLVNQDMKNLLFGNGFGGYIEEGPYYYGNYLNNDDYSIDQIKTGKYQVLHGYNQIILKHGLFSLAIALFLFIYYRKRPYRNLRDASLIFIVFSYSFTVKPYLILGLLLSSLSKRKGGEFEE